jgi:hypothetical protein
MKTTDPQAFRQTLEGAELALRCGVELEINERMVQIVDVLAAALERSKGAPEDADLLRRMAAAQEARDWIALADILAFEVPNCGLFPTDSAS